MWLIEDTRQQSGQHIQKHLCFSHDGVQIIRCKLPFGDYALPPKIAVDTKKGLEEIAKNICGNKTEHQRFKRECVGAKDAGCHLIFLIENDEGISDLSQVHLWVNPRTKVQPDCVQGPRLEKAMRTMSERYGCEFLFCKYSETAARIVELLRVDE